MGGSGKTPLTIHVAEMLRDLGRTPAVISRGYKGSYTGEYLVVGGGDSKEPEVGPAECGDEPFLIAWRLPDIPVLVGRQRLHAVNAARDRFECDVVVLDDGFQHLPLKRDADIVLINGAEDHMFPRGRLREPLSALRRADMLILVGEHTEIPTAVGSYLSGKPVFRCRHIAVGLTGGPQHQLAAPDVLTARKVLLVSAIANPERFRLTAEGLGWNVIDHIAFRDHHWMTDEEIQRALRRAAGAQVVVTEKDWVKLPGWAAQTGQILALSIGVQLDDEDAFRRSLMDLLHQ